MLMQIKAIMKSHYSSVRLTQVYMVESQSAIKDLEMGTYMYEYGKTVFYSPFGKVIVDVSFIVPTRVVFVFRNGY